MIAARQVQLRRYPFPYRAMLAVCSDLDLTPTAEHYIESLRFLNTTATTRFGRGVGLETGNSIYFDMPPGHVSYWNADEHTRAQLRTLMASGHIDCLHSFGDLATTRQRAGAALDELDRHGCRMQVWVDHAVAPSNFGADRMAGQGDVVTSPVFHADLSCGFGIEYVWRGRVTSVAGQNAPRSLRGLFDTSAPLTSLTTLAKETSKGALASAGSIKYAMHGPNRLTRPVRLRSGHAVHEFIRANPHRGGVSCGDTADGLGEVLTVKFLDRLAEREAVTVLYTHLGKFRDRAEPFSAVTRAGLARLGARQAAGDILVTTTARLLDYCTLTEAIAITASEIGDMTWVDVATPAAPVASRSRSLDGLTIYVDRPESTRVRVSGRECTELRRNPPDHTGRPSVSIPWTRLEFPQV
ncbi:MAG TPA: hypothetical protein VFV51_04465 [Vicinamibacterales bacterium]|nr:hypothetical protein [Vicinamibacterales bacterium]